MEDSKIDILAINESKLDDTINDDELYLPGFEIVRKDRMLNGRNGGGVCLYLRSNLNYRIREDLIIDKLECLTVEIIKPRSRPFLVSTCIDLQILRLIFSTNLKTNIKSTL